MIQLYIYRYIYIFFNFVSIVAYYKILNIDPCALYNR